MIIAERLRQLRAQKHLSQGDIQNRTGLLRCYVSRVENGYTVPSYRTLEKFARALEVPMYQLFYDGGEPLERPNFPGGKYPSIAQWGESGSDARLLAELCRIFSRLDERKLKLLYAFARNVVKSKARPSH
jgi:transcriptional regulator with XRE-family HTH domain